MKSDYVKSSPTFFRLIKLSAALVLVLLLVGAIIIPAPLQEPATMTTVPNPVKSAWFLLWIQEVVSYSRYLIYAVAMLAAVFLALPWLAVGSAADTARWFPRQQRPVITFTLIVFIAIVGLTVVALFFRGANWSLGA